MIFDPWRDEDYWPVEGYRLIALEEEQSSASEHAAGDCSSARSEGSGPPAPRSLPPEGPAPTLRATKRKPPKAKPRTKCTLCGRVGRYETFIHSPTTGSHYCMTFDKCDRKRGVIASRKAK